MSTGTASFRFSGLLVFCQALLEMAHGDSRLQVPEWAKPSVLSPESGMGLQGGVLVLCQLLDHAQKHDGDHLGVLCLGLAHE